MAVMGSRVGIDENDNSAKLRAERRIFEAEKAEASALQQREKTADVGRAAMISPAPKPTVPYLPEREEEGPLGEIMKAAPTGVQTAYERMPIEERPIELIRGTERTYWSPGTRQEYGDIRTAMTGFKPRPEAERRDVGVATGMTPYQQATLGLRGEELGFKQSQAELDYITKGLETRFASMADMEQQPTQDQITSETGKLRNEWIKANYSPKEAKSLIAQTPIELRPNKKTGELRWFNAYGKPIKTEAIAKPAAEADELPDVPAITFDPRTEIAPELREEAPAAIIDRPYATWQSRMKKTPQQGFKEIGEALDTMGLSAEDFETAGKLYKNIGTKAWGGYLDFFGKALESQRKATARLGGAR